MKIFILVTLLSLALANAPLHCGVVSDGLNNQDIDVQASLKKISASWTGFEDGWERNRVLRYEWAVITASRANERLKTQLCRDNPGFLGQPDVLGWTNVERATSASANVRLQHGETYIVVVRASTALGTQKYTNSDGVYVDKDAAVSTNTKRDSEQKATKNTVTINDDCIIDQEWRCNAGQVSVREYLEQFYGPPQFLVENSAIIIFRPPVVVPIVEEGDDDDDDDLTTGDVIGIAIGITAFFCFLAIGIILIASFLGKKGDKFDTNVRKHENVEEF